MANDEEQKLRLGKRIRTARKGRGLTQAALAEHSDVSTETVSRIERGEVWPGVPVAMSMAAALRMSVDSLLGLKGTPRAPHRPEIAKAINLIEQLDVDVLDGLLVLLGRLTPRRRATRKPSR